MKIFRATAIFGAAIIVGAGLGLGCRGERETLKETNEAEANVLIEESAVADKNVPATNAIDPKNCRALLIGVDEYEKLPSLEYASYDVKKIRGALLEIGFPEECVRMFVSDGKISERPSRKRILEAFDKMLSETDGDSTVFVVFSGHGFETKNGDAAFCPEDVDIKTTEDGTPVVTSSTAILLDDVVKRLQNDDARFKMLVVDACREPVSTARKINARARSFAPVDASGLAFLQSCGSRELSWEHPDVGGVFTHFLVEGLRGGAARENGGVTFLDACGYASKETQRFVADRRSVEQTPFFTFSGVVDFYLKAPRPNDDEEKEKRARAERLYREGRDLAYGMNRTKLDTRQGLRLLTEAMLAGSLDAQAEIPELLIWGGGSNKTIDKEKAYELAWEPARQGNPFALNSLGDLAKQKGDGATANEYYAKALREYEIWAEQGDSRAINCLGRAFLSGWGGSVRDAKKAFECFQKAAELGLVDAIANVGFCYNNGIGVEIDMENAKNYYREAAELKSPWAMRAIADCYLAEQNFEEAAFWCEKGVENGEIYAMEKLAKLLDEGKGTEKNIARATELYRRAADLGNVAAMNAMAERYVEGKGVERNLREAKRWCDLADNREKRFEVCLQAANEGEDWAPYWVGTCYEYGRGVEKNWEQAIRWYRRGAELEELTAMRALAYCYEYGQGVELDYDEALRLYRKGAARDHGMSILGVGTCYEHGRGVEKDLAEALKWYRKAENHTEARVREYGRNSIARLKKLDPTLDK